MDREMTERIREAEVVFAEGTDGDPVLVWGEAVLRSIVKNQKARELRIMMMDGPPEEARRIVKAIKASVSDGAHGGSAE
jgi:hypothetical protein